MNLMDELAAETTHHGSVCGVRKYLESASKEDGDELRAALDSTHSSSALARVLKRRGVVLSVYVLQYHRRGDCLCRSKTS